MRVTATNFCSQKINDLYSSEPEFNSGAMALGYTRCDSLYSSDENGCEKDSFFCPLEDEMMTCNTATLLDNIESISSTSSSVSHFASSAETLS